MLSEPVPKVVNASPIALALGEVLTSRKFIVLWATLFNPICEKQIEENKERMKTGTINFLYIYYVNFI
ncbi:MAG: hypothetical protein C4539_16440 [Ignavibacteriales bacterium]|nr:MAG: hypothetical protein C4539_16440 [Ignavibacteriales bacterium]